MLQIFTWAMGSLVLCWLVVAFFALPDLIGLALGKLVLWVGHALGFE